MKPKEVQLSVERVPGTLSTASKSVQVNGAATVSNSASSQANLLTGGRQCVVKFVQLSVLVTHIMVKKICMRETCHLTLN